MSGVDSRTHYTSYHRQGDKYPRHVIVDWRRAKIGTLKKYADTFELNLRPDLTAGEFAVAVARHFDNHLDVDEEEVLGRFMNAARKVPPPAPQEALGKRTTSQRRTGDRTAGAGDMISTDDAIEAAERDGDDHQALGRTRSSAVPAVEVRRGGGGDERGFVDSRGAGGGGRGSAAGLGGAPARSADTTTRGSSGMAGNGEQQQQQSLRGGGERNASAAAASAGGADGAGADAKRRRIASASAGGGGGGRMEVSSDRGMENDQSDNHEQQQGNGHGHSNDPVEAETDDGSEVYCLCRRISYGEMIACDNRDCPIEWFHLGCVGLTTANRPRGKWFCPECRSGSGSEDEGADKRMAGRKRGFQPQMAAAGRGGRGNVASMPGRGGGGQQQQMSQQSVGGQLGSLTSQGGGSSGGMPNMGPGMQQQRQQQQPTSYTGPLISSSGGAGGAGPLYRPGGGGVLQGGGGGPGVGGGGIKRTGGGVGGGGAGPTGGR